MLKWRNGLLVQWAHVCSFDRCHHVPPQSLDVESRWERVSSWGAQLLTCAEGAGRWPGQGGHAWARSRLQSSFICRLRWG